MVKTQPKYGSYGVYKFMTKFVISPLGKASKKIKIIFMEFSMGGGGVGGGG